nr:serine/threonine-protein kinase HT1-like isoform X1 [Tanacetum cinerariifolium]
MPETPPKYTRSRRARSEVVTLLDDISFDSDLGFVGGFDNEETTATQPHDQEEEHAAADAKYYGNVETYNILKARGAKVPKTRKTPMPVANPREVPEHELNPLELHIRKSDGISKGNYQVAKWNGTKVSVKILDKDSYSDPESINAFKHELTLLEKVRHPNVVQFVGAVTQNVPMMIVSEFHPRGDLRSYLQKKDGCHHPKLLDLLSILPGKGMNYLHECKPDPVIHCDLRPKLAPNKARLARPATVDRENLYIAPEIYKDELFDRGVDVYSFGIILYEQTKDIEINIHFVRDFVASGQVHVLHVLSRLQSREGSGEILQLKKEPGRHIRETITITSTQNTNGIVQVEEVEKKPWPWVGATKYVKANGGIVNGCLGDIKTFLKNEKLEQVVSIINSCSPNALGDLKVTVKDLSGTGSIHCKVIIEEGYKKEITVGSAIILNILVFSSNLSMHYLNITKKNVVKVFHKDFILGNGSGVGGSGMLMEEEEIVKLVEEEEMADLELHVCGNVIDQEDLYKFDEKTLDLVLEEKARESKAHEKWLEKCRQQEEEDPKHERHLLGFHGII